MEIDQLKQEIAGILATANPARKILEDALEEVLFSLEIAGHSRAADTRAKCDKGGPLHEEALTLLKNMAILLSAADEMASEPNLFNVFAAACMEISPPPTDETLCIIASAHARMDLLMCDNAMKGKFFREHFIIE